MPGDSGVLVVTRVRSITTKCTRGRGCSGHPAFPTPSTGRKSFCKARAHRAARSRSLVSNWSAVIASAALQTPSRCQRVRAKRGPMTGSASNPESRDSGSGPADHPGMTVSGLHVIASAANPLFLFAARWIASRSLLSGGASAVRKLDHGLAGRHLLARLVAHHDIDQHPARIRRDLFRFDDAGRLDGVARPDRLDPPGFEAAMNGAGGIGPVGDHPRDQPEIVHAVHDDAAETGLAEIALHVLVVEMQRVVVERGVAEQADGFAADREFRTVDRIAGPQIFERGAHEPLPFTSAGWSGRARNRSLRHAG